MAAERPNAVHHPVTGPSRLLDRATLDRMYAAGVRMLGETGIQVEHTEMREAIAKRDGFTLHDGRIRVSAAKAEATLKALRENAAPPPKRNPDSPLTLGVDDRASWIVDKDGTALRPMLRADVVESAKLVAMLHDRGVSGTTTGVPTDVPAPLIPLDQFMIGAEFSREGGGSSDVLDIYTAGVFRELNRACGRGFNRSIWSPSPLIFGGAELDIIWHFRNEVEFICVGSMPIMGMTGPCDPIGVFTLAAAECLGNAAIVRELLPKAGVMIWPHPEPADMGSGVMVFGTPEWDLLDLMHRDVHEYYGGRTDQKLIHTTASLPGAQAVSDHAGSMMLGAIYGLTHFSPGGMLALDEVWSPALLVIDAEILAHTRRIVQGVSTGEGLGLEELAGVVAEVVKEGGVFGDHESTVANMRSQYHRPRVNPRMNRAQWERAGRPDEIRTAQAEANRLIATFDYVAPAAQLKELRAIYEKAKAHLLGKA
ncbi:MAG: trimethylamine methyltransferase family protein [Candidatus Coatesbacteria bacterium]